MTGPHGPPDVRERDARRSFRRLMIYTVIAGVVMVIGSVVYLSFSEVMDAATVIATTVGVFLSVLLGAGLMALGFLSSNSGHDDRVADHRNRSKELE